MKLPLLGVITALTVTLCPISYAFYTDTQGYWAEQSIEKLSQKGIIGGYPNGTFKPNGYISRAEFASILAKATNTQGQSVSNQTHFGDVTSNFWAYRPIAIVSDNGLVAGYPGGYFYPNQRITKAEVMTVLSKAASLPQQTPQEAERILARYQDANSVPQWARVSVATAINANIIANSPNNNLIEANTYATRGDVAAMTDNMLVAMAHNNSSTANNPYVPSSNSSYPQNYDPNYGPTQSSGYGSYPQQEALRGYVSTIPTGTTMNITTSTSISSETAHDGDPVTAMLTHDVASGGRLMLSAGSQIKGQVVSNVPAGRLNKPGQFQLRFTQAILPDGHPITLSARLVTEDRSGIIKGGTTASRYGDAAKNTLGGAVIGGLGGAAITAITSHGRKPLQGLLWGSAIGAGAGLAKTAIDRGDEAQLETGTPLQIRLDQPLSLSFDTAVPTNTTYLYQSNPSY